MEIWTIPPEEATFIYEIRADIFSDEPRLIYSDWLDDQQDHRAEYVRAEISLANFDPFSDEARTEFERLRQLVASHSFSWSWRREIGVQFDYMRRIRPEKKRLWNSKEHIREKLITQSVSFVMLVDYPSQFRQDAEYFIRKHQRI